MTEKIQKSSGADLAGNLANRLNEVELMDEESVRKIVEILKKHQYSENRSDSIVNIHRILKNLTGEGEE